MMFVFNLLTHGITQKTKAATSNMRLKFNSDLVCL